MIRRLAVWAAALATAIPAAPALGATAMPLVEFPATRAGDTLVVFYSGDGGWASLDHGVATDLAGKGFAVVGVNTLRYFLARHEPQAAADDLTQVIARYSRQWGRQRIVLAGYSWGAEVLPLVVRKLPPDIRARISLVAMLSPGATAELEFQPGDWINFRSKAKSIPLAPAVDAMKELNTLCLYGADEKSPACPGFAAAIDRTVRLPGDHHFAGRYDLIADAIAQGAGG